MPARCASATWSSPIKGFRNLFIGRITGEYVWRGDDADLRDHDYCNTRPVEWLKKDVPRIAFSAAALHSFGSFASISTSDDFLEEVQTVLRGEAVETVERARPSDAGEPDTSDDEVDDEAVRPAADSEQETQDYLLKSWSCTGQHFETVVAAVFRAMGYTARVQEGTHDRGLYVVAQRSSPPSLPAEPARGAATPPAPSTVLPPPPPLPSTGAGSPQTSMAQPPANVTYNINVGTHVGPGNGLYDFPDLPGRLETGRRWYDEA